MIFANLLLPFLFLSSNSVSTTCILVARLC
uniref:Uncharacterized protein n=1 Tax=Rhizophora mucronata TaxID=61149 RepID=A0A2P2IPX8_RHIMU